MRTTQGPNRISVLDIGLGVDLVVYRIVRSDNPDDPVFLNSLRSHYELTQEPRGVERQWSVIHTGISVYQERVAAQGTAIRFPVIGDYIARLELQPGMGINYAHTGPVRHLTLWAEPVKLREVTTDITAVES